MQRDQLRKNKQWHKQGTFWSAYFSLHLLKLRLHPYIIRLEILIFINDSIHVFLFWSVTAFLFTFCVIGISQWRTKHTPKNHQPKISLFVRRNFCIRTGDSRGIETGRSETEREIDELCASLAFSPSVLFELLKRSIRTIRCRAGVPVH